MTCLANEAAVEWGDTLRHRTGLNQGAAASMMWAPWSTTNRKLALVKALTAWATEEVATQCRQHCGVAGVLLVNRFLDYLGLGQVFNDASGNNFLILLDTARMMVSGAIVPPERRAAGDEWAEVRVALDALRMRERRLIRALVDGVAERTASGLDSLEVWNPLLPSARDAAGGIWAESRNRRGNQGDRTRPSATPCAGCCEISLRCSSWIVHIGMPLG